MKSHFLVFINIFLLLFLCLSCGEQQEEVSRNGSQYSTTNATTTNNDEDQDPIIAKAKPYLDAIVLEDSYLRTQAVGLCSECPSGDKECQLNEIYRYIVENFNYYSDPRVGEYIQSPIETIRIGGGDCEDLTILLLSLLENIGIPTHIILTSDHAFGLACGINNVDLWSYIETDLKEQLAEDLNVPNEEISVVIENEEVYLVCSFQESFLLEPNYYRYFSCFGGDGTELDYPNEYIELRYSVNSSQPVDIYVFCSLTDFNNFIAGDNFGHYANCYFNNVYSKTGSCVIPQKGILAVGNNGYYSATTEIDLEFYYHYPFDLSGRTQITGCSLNSENCIILEPTAGEYGYPGYSPNVTGEAIAIDPVTNQYYSLTF